jgi:uncharacterized protein YaeQ
MANTSTLYRFHIDLSDIDRGIYEELDFRVAMHPSETAQYLVTRVLAYSLNKQDGLDFTPGGLSDTDAPCLKVDDPRGGVALWIEVGSPSMRKLHKAAKASRAVKVYTYKDPRHLMAEIEAAKVYHADEIEIYSLAPAFLDQLGKTLERDNEWSVIHTDGAITVNVGTQSEQGELVRHYAKSV